MDYIILINREKHDIFAQPYFEGYFLRISRRITSYERADNRHKKPTNSGNSSCVYYLHSLICFC